RPIGGGMTPQPLPMVAFASRSSASRACRSAACRATYWCHHHGTATSPPAALREVADADPIPLADPTAAAINAPTPEVAPDPDAQAIAASVSRATPVAVPVPAAKPVAAAVEAPTAVAVPALRPRPLPPPWRLLRRL